MLRISPYKGSRDHKVKRLGRGVSSGIGGRSTRGTKGQNARKSGTVRLGFEGGQMPLYRKVGKYGFNNYEFRRNVKAVNIKILNNYKDVKLFDKEFLLSKGIIKKKDKYLKFIGNETEIKGSVFHADFYSEGALEILKSNKNTINYIVKKQ